MKVKILMVVLALVFFVGAITITGLDTVSSNATVSNSAPSKGRYN